MSILTGLEINGESTIHNVIQHAHIVEHIFYIYSFYSPFKYKSCNFHQFVIVLNRLLRKGLLIFFLLAISFNLFWFLFPLVILYIIVLIYMQHMLCCDVCFVFMILLIMSVLVALSCIFWYLSIQGMYVVFLLCWNCFCDKLSLSFPVKSLKRSHYAISMQNILGILCQPLSTLPAIDWRPENYFSWWIIHTFILCLSLETLQADDRYLLSHS